MWGVLAAGVGSCPAIGCRAPNRPAGVTPPGGVQALHLLRRVGASRFPFPVRASGSGFAIGRRGPAFGVVWEHPSPLGVGCGREYSDSVRVGDRL